MSEIKLKDRLYTATAVSTGGRNGHTKNGNGIVNFDLSMPGGPSKPGATTPEDLFAAGYAACFGSACDVAAKRVLKLNPSAIEVHSQVTLGTDETGGYGFEILMKVRVSGVTNEQAKAIAESGHQICPYSKAMKGNVRIALEAQAI